MEGWISVKDRLPEKEGRYLVSYKLDVDMGDDGEPYDIIDVEVMHFFADPQREFSWDDNYYEYTTDEILAWMPLPEPYTSEVEP